MPKFKSDTGILNQLAIQQYLPYSPPRILFNAHLETIYPSLFRKVDLTPYVRERIDTPDDDFLDIDWLRHSSAKLISASEPSLVIISHGLEGNTERGYVKGMARAFFDAGFDVLAWNFRSCSGETNRQMIFYHSGATYDLDTVISHALLQDAYTKVYLVGFSLGGNMILKYLGERGGLVPKQITKSVVFSVPMDLPGSSVRLNDSSNWIYSQRFLRHLKNKILTKAALQPALNTEGIEKIKTLRDFDNRYTAPLHGYKDAEEYYIMNSANRFVGSITVPSLIINAQNDPFLSPECFPSSMLEGHEYVSLEIPARGGHVGFTLFNANGLYWSEIRALEFVQR